MFLDGCFHFQLFLLHICSPEGPVIINNYSYGGDEALTVNLNITSLDPAPQSCLSAVALSCCWDLYPRSFGREKRQEPIIRTTKRSFFIQQLFIFFVLLFGWISDVIVARWSNWLETLWSGEKYIGSCSEEWVIAWHLECRTLKCVSVFAGCS